MNEPHKTLQYCSVTLSKNIDRIVAELETVSFLIILNIYCTNSLWY